MHSRLNVSVASLLVLAACFGALHAVGVASGEGGRPRPAVPAMMVTSGARSSESGRLGSERVAGNGGPGSAAAGPVAAVGGAGEPSTSISTSTSVLSPKRVEARALIDALGERFPFPDEVRACAASRLVELGQIDGVERPAGDGPVPKVVLDAGARCMFEVRSLRQFLVGLDRVVPGGLSRAQRACVRQGFLGLKAGELGGAATAALNPRSPGVEGAGAVARIDEMVEACGVEVRG